MSLQPPKKTVLFPSSFFLFVFLLAKEVEVQRRVLSCPRSHSWEGEEGIPPGPRLQGCLAPPRKSVGFPDLPCGVPQDGFQFLPIVKKAAMVISLGHVTGVKWLDHRVSEH